MPIHSITDNPLDRVPDEMRKLLADKNCRFDVHCHIFNYCDVPDRFLGIRFPFDERLLVLFEKKLHNIIKRRDNDPFSNLAYFIDVFRTRSPEEMFLKLKSYYPGDKTIFCPLMMDMRPGIRGKMHNDYNAQIENMTAVRNKFPASILPFFAADPNNPDVKRNFFRVFSQEEKYRFFGVKIYPSLGYLPSNPILMDLYAICEEKNIPVTTHCSSAIVHSSQKIMRNIQGWHYTPGKGFVNMSMTASFTRRSDYAEFFNHPRNWIPVLENFPKLRLNLAHFGGEHEWKRYLKGKGDNWVSRIKDLMEKYENVYTDVSYTLFKKQIYPDLKNLIQGNELLTNRILFGSDYYMIVTEGFFRALRINFLTAMGDDIIAAIAGENPRRFLFGADA